MAAAIALGVQLLGQAPADLVEHEPDQRLGPADVRRRQAAVALARKIAVILHRMWSDGTEFRYS